jgi:hypothetical protein
MRHICDVEPDFQQNVDILSHDFWLLCYVQAAVKGNVDVLSQDLCKNTDAAVRRKKE